MFSLLLLLSCCQIGFSCYFCGLDVSKKAVVGVVVSIVVAGFGTRPLVMTQLVYSDGILVLYF